MTQRYFRRAPPVLAVLIDKFQIEGKDLLFLPNIPLIDTQLSTLAEPCFREPSLAQTRYRHPGKGESKPIRHGTLGTGWGIIEI